jgi:hypothetical protein
MDKICLDKSFLVKILKTINRLCENCVLKIENNSIYSISSSSDNVIVLYIKGDLAEDTNFTGKINIIDIKRFLCGLDCLDSSKVELEINENFVKCLTKDSEDPTHFKYHLVDDTVMSKSNFNIKKISQLTFDTEFVIPLNSQRKIITGYSFSADCQKVYLKESEGAIYAEINDHTQHNKDSVELKITDEYRGEIIKQPIPVNIEIFKNLMYSKNSNILVKINNEFKVLVFNVKEDDSIDVKYITSALVK